MVGMIMVDEGGCAKGWPLMLMILWVVAGGQFGQEL